MKQFEARLGPQFGLLWRDADLSLAPELAPVIDGKLTSLTNIEEELEARRISMGQYKQIREQHTALSADFTQVLLMLRRLQQVQEAIRALKRALVRPIIQQAVAEAAAAFRAMVQQYFQEVEEALNEDIERFQEPVSPGQPSQHAGQHASPTGYGDLFQEYQVNIIVDNTDLLGLPLSSRRRQSTRTYWDD